MIIQITNSLNFKERTIMSEKYFYRVYISCAFLDILPKYEYEKLSGKSIVSKYEIFPK